MNCETCREAISARLDGEVSELSSELVDVHLADCADCRQFEQRAMIMNRRLRVGVAAPMVDRTERIVNAVVNAGSGWRLDLVRALLVGLAAVEIVTGAMTLFAVGRGGVVIHDSRELGGFGVAFGIGLLLAAISPVRIAGLFPVVVTVAVTSLVGAAVDVASGQTFWAGELHHMLEFAAVLALWRLTRPVRIPPRRLAPSS